MGKLIVHNALSVNAVFESSSPAASPTPAPAGSASPTPPSSGDGGSGPGDEDLPDTGLSLCELVAVAAALLLAGLGGAVVRLRS